MNIISSEGYITTESSLLHGVVNCRSVHLEQSTRPLECIAGRSVHSCSERRTGRMSAIRFNQDDIVFPLTNILPDRTDAWEGENAPQPQDRQHGSMSHHFVSTVMGHASAPSLMLIVRFGAGPSVRVLE